MTSFFVRIEPASRHSDWQRHASCRGLMPDLFFSYDGESRLSRARRERAAVEVCTRCPVRPQCRHHALTYREQYGVWGGTTENDRRRGGPRNPITPMPSARSKPSR